MKRTAKAAREAQLKAEVNDVTIPEKDEQDTFYINGEFCFVPRLLPYRFMRWKKVALRWRNICYYMYILRDE